jgi:HAD superfamily hydrolase (TIGR01509 family)
MTDTVIFDMDGLLVDSEPLWTIAMQDVFSSVGAYISPELAAKTTGLRTVEVVDFWYDYFKWEGKSKEQVSGEIIEAVSHQVMTKGRLMEGVNDVLELVRRKGMKMGLASSSPICFIERVLEHFWLKDYFQEVSSAEFESYGKPHPGVYLTCAGKLGSSPLNCLAFEDSVNGMIAAKAARMKVVAVPEEHNLNNPRYVLADLKLDSLTQFTEDHLLRLS